MRPLDDAYLKQLKSAGLVVVGPHSPDHFLVHGFGVFKPAGVNQMIESTTEPDVHTAAAEKVYRRIDQRKGVLRSH